MLTYKLLPTNTRSMPLNVSSEVFVAEWKACWENRDRDLTTLIKMGQPFLNNWEQMLTRSEHFKDINFLSLHRLLESAGGDPFLRIEDWISEARILASVQEELLLLFVEQVRTPRYFPEFAKPRMAEFVFARNFKLKLLKRIIALSQPKVDATRNVLTFTEVTTEDSHPDYLLLKNLNFNPWERYLFLLCEQRMNPYDIAELTHVPRETFYYEEKEIWRRIKQMFCAKEMLVISKHS